MSKVTPSFFSAAALLSGCSSSPPSTPPGPDGTPLPSDIAITIGNEARGTFLFQDGEGPWQLAPAAVANIIRLPVQAARYGFAFHCQDSNRGHIYYHARTEGARDHTQCATAPIAPPPPDGILSGTLIGPADRRVEFSFGHVTYSEVIVATGVSQPYEISPPQDTSDLVITSSDADVETFDIERDVALGAALTRNYDLNSLPPPELVEQPGSGGDWAWGFLDTPTTFAFYTDFAAPFYHPALPAAQRRPTDLWNVGIIKSDGGFRDIYVSSPMPVASPPANPLQATFVADATGLNVQWTPVTGYPDTFMFVSGAGWFGSVQLSAAWVAAGAAEVSIPNFAALSAWTAEDFQTIAIGSSLTISKVEGTPLQLGAIYEGFSRESDSSGVKALPHRTQLHKARQLARREARLTQLSM